MKIDEGYVACICEGSAEQAIIELLLENDKLIFSDDMLLEGEIIRCRGAKSFEKRYLSKGFKQKITVIRILDSRNENFNLSKAYEDKVKVINVITAPEIEMLVIISKGEYEHFKNSRIMKPSEYCKSVLKLKSIKSYGYVKDYFSDSEELIKCINEYKRLSKINKGEYTIADIIK